jgi:hypothetical protein
MAHPAEDIRLSALLILKVESSLLLASCFVVYFNLPRRHMNTNSVHDGTAIYLPFKCNEVPHGIKRIKIQQI